MRTATSTTFTALIAALVLAACGATDDTSAGTDRELSGTASAPSTSTSAPESPTPSTTPDAPAQSSPSTPAAAPAEPSTPAVSKLAFMVGGKKQDVTPTEVYCSGKPGTIAHIIGKSNQRPPLVEVDQKRFVLVKVGNGKPFTTQSAAGVSYTRTAVTFDRVDVGGGVLNGTMACTTFEG